MPVEIMDRSTVKVITLLLVLPRYLDRASRSDI